MPQITEGDTRENDDSSCDFWLHAQGFHTERQESQAETKCNEIRRAESQEFKETRPTTGRGVESYYLMENIGVNDSQNIAQNHSGEIGDVSHRDKSAEQAV